MASILCFHFFINPNYLYFISPVFICLIPIVITPLISLIPIYYYSHVLFITPLSTPTLHVLLQTTLIYSHLPFQLFFFILAFHVLILYLKIYFYIPNSTRFPTHLPYLLLPSFTTDSNYVFPTLLQT